MSTRHTHLLYLGPTQMQAYAWSSKHLSLTQSFPDTQAGLEQFVEYLKQHPFPHLMLVDVVEEDFRLETIPHVHGRKHDELIERKLDWHYKNLPFRLAMFRQRLESGRRDDEILLSALTNQQHLAPWLQCIQSTGSPLAGMYTPAYLANELLQQARHEHVLLLTWQANSGLRQSYFRNRHLCLSRLTPVEAENDFPNQAHNETLRLMRHLENSGQLKPDSVLNVYLVCREADFAKLTALPDHPTNIRYSFLDISRAEAGSGIHGQTLLPDATLLYLNILGNKQPPVQYAPETHTHHYWLWRQRNRLKTSAAVCLFAALAISTAMLVKTHNYSQEIQALRQETDRYSAQIESLLSTRPATAVSIDEMKSAVTFFDSLDKLLPPPEAHLHKLAFALDQHPQILAQKIGWQTDIGSTNLPDNPHHTIRFEGELAGFSNEYRDALSYLEQFKAALESQGLTVIKQSLPVDTSVNGNIHAEQGSEISALKFSLELKSQ